MFVFFYRTIKFSFQGFFRNIWLSIVTIIILILTLLSVTTVAGINVVANQTLASVEDKVDVSVYFKPDVEEENVLSMQYRLEEISQVQSVNYVSKDEALEKFKAEHADESVILESLDQFEENPLGATLVIKANDIDDYPDILAFLENSDYDQLISDKNFDDNEAVINRLSDISVKIQNIGVIISGIFVIIAIMIIFNTIRINIYTHREEIGIMKLVGASNWFVRAPFLVESLMYAVFAVIITMAVLYPLLSVVAPQIDNFFQGYNLNLIEYFNTHVLKIIGYQIAFAVLLSVISSSIAIGRYMRV
ncbi:permease-like cell division protein FtsX [Patescibacteria group bacterium]|nr:permease-like cell division protein FtsX [Patescibacteria group bacterium]MBU0963481.1 permease-like cell division protein FtsX [Patescibacteria group bacterium]